MAAFSKTIEQLVKIAKRLGANPVTLGPTAPISIAGTIQQMINRGEVSNLVPDEPIYTPDGEVLFLYIPDHNYLFTREQQDTPENRNKVHLFYCQTLRDMEARGRKFRYIATNERSGKFEVKYTNTNKQKVHLNVCQHCHKLLHSRLYGTFAQFDFDKFATNHNYCPPYFNNIPKTAYGVEYPTNWPQISYKVRKERGWRCEKCGRDFSRQKQNLHLHHINGIKSDCSRSNLKALCKKCHSEEPGHSHMKTGF